VIAQEVPATNIERAVRLRDAGDFESAVRILEAVVSRQPDEAEPARLLAQTLYWMGQFARARLAYERALATHPGDARLRLEFGRMLVETQRSEDARRVLEPLRDVPSAQSDAETLLGTLAYWQGDLASARLLFVSALRVNPGQPDATRQLREIQLLTAPWIRAALTVGYDDQPLDQVAAAIEAGWYPTPLLTVRLRSEPARYAIPAIRHAWVNAVELSYFAPQTRMEVAMSGGVLTRGNGQPLDWTARAELGWRVAHGVSVVGRVERSPYLYTLASLDTRVMTDKASALVRLNHSRGWLGEAAVQRQRYSDGNIGSTSHAWLLAPLVWRSGAQLQAGYAIASADTREDRFLPTGRPAGEPGPTGGIPLEGRYLPYHTPQNLLTHSVTSALAVGRASGPTLRLSGSYGVRATEDATSFFLTSTGIQSEVGQRTFTPWTGRVSVAAPAGSTTTFELRAEAGRTAFYRWRSVGLHVLYRLRGDRLP
jgi:Tfp pilus assembly protein PilF